MAMKRTGLALLALLWSAPAFAACPAGQSEMLTARLYFGQSMNGRAIAAAAWRDFLMRTVTPRFPAGFTVYDAQGQWRNPATRAVTREASKVIEIVAPDTRELRDGIEAVRGNYIARFHQQAVGLTIFAVCGTFQ
jgi:hypothetical protein